MMWFSHLAFALAVRCITFPREGKTSGEISPKNSDLIYFYLLVLFFSMFVPDFCGKHGDNEGVR